MAKFRVTFTSVVGEADPLEEVEADRHSVDGEWIVFVETQDQGTNAPREVQVARIPSANVLRIDLVR